MKIQITLVLVFFSFYLLKGQQTPPNFANLDTLCEGVIYEIYIEPDETLWLYNSDDKFTFESWNGGSGGDGFSATNNTSDQQIIFAIQNSGETGSSQISILSSFDWITNDYPFDEINWTDGSCSTVPITWYKKITATIKDSRSIIKWSVASQINNEKFRVEYCTDGKSFSSIGEVKGDGTYMGIKQFEFIHKIPKKGINYYRIKQLDFDGQYTYSGIVSVNFEAESINSFPNPVTDKLTINSSYEAGLEIYNQFGQLINERRLISGNNEVEMSHLIPGIYIFKTEFGEVWKVIRN